MRPRIIEPMNEEGVTRLMEYIIITGVLLLLDGRHDDHRKRYAHGGAGEQTPPPRLCGI